MRTNAPILFAVFAVAALSCLVFGFYPLLFIASGLILLALWSRFRHPHTWKGNGYTITIGRGWLNYEENGRVLSLRAEYLRGELYIDIDKKVYFPPDYQNALPEERVAEIKQRISYGLDQRKGPLCLYPGRPTRFVLNHSIRSV